ncbi:MAG: deoxyribonuclease IV [Bacilli bacterium]
MLIIGSHVSCSGKEMLLGSVEEAISYNANTFMFYTGAPQNTKRKRIDEFNVSKAKELMSLNGIDFNNIIVHAPYIINLANTTNIKTFELAVEFLKKEIIRCEKIGIKTIVLHPGSHVNKGSDVGIKRIIEGLNLVLRENQTVSIAIETMSGKGSECGCTFEEIAQIIDGVKLNHLLKVCLDTCHLNDAGYDIVNDLDNVIDKFDKIIGLDKISVIHVNDSKNILGAKKDRHENIGYGTIGFDALLKIIYHPSFNNIPMILETPYIDNGSDSKLKYSPYKYEIAMIKNKCFDESLKKKVILDE